jgi:hypothetical protein
MNAEQLKLATAVVWSVGVVVILVLLREDLGKLRRWIGRKLAGEADPLDWPDLSHEHEFASWAIVDEYRDLAHTDVGFWTVASSPVQRRRCTACGLTQEISITFRSAKGIKCGAAASRPA